MIVREIASRTLDINNERSLSVPVGPTTFESGYTPLELF